MFFFAKSEHFRKAMTLRKGTGLCLEENGLDVSRSLEGISPWFAPETTGLALGDSWIGARFLKGAWVKQ